MKNVKKHKFLQEVSSKICAEIAKIIARKTIQEGRQHEFVRYLTLFYQEVEESDETLSLMDLAKLHLLMMP